MGDQQQQQQQQQQPQQMQMDSNIVKLRGLPWNVTPKEILQFLDGVQVDKGENGVHLITSPRDGRPNGEAFVECATEADVAKAFEFQNKTLGHRYIEIFNAQVDEFESVLNKQHVVQMDTFIKLRGLPYSITADEIEQFFDGLQLNKDQDVHIVMDNRGRASGEAFVRFGNLDDTEKALKRNREKIGHRYIEIFRSTNSEFRRNMYGSNRPGPYDRGNNMGGNGGMGNGGMGGGGGPIRNNFNGPRGRMMRGGGYDGGNNGPWKSRPNTYDNFYEDDGGYSNGGGCVSNQNTGYNNNGNAMGGGFGGNGGGYRGGSNDYSNNNSYAMAGGNRGFNSGGGSVGGSAFSTSSSMGIGAGAGGMNTGTGVGMNSFGSGGGYNGNGAFGGGAGATGGLGMGTSGGVGLSPMGGGMGNTGGVGGGGYRNNNGNGNGFNDFSQTNSYGNGGGGNAMGNGGGGAWRDMSSGGSAGGGGGMNDTFCVHMRGMPYYCDEQDIYKFFAPLKPINCQVIYNNRGLHSGEADAVFANQADAMQAMAKNKEKMGTRYIELFYKSGGNQQNTNMNNNMNRRRY